MQNSKLKIRNSIVEFLMFTSKDNKEQIEVRYYDETIWASQNNIAKLFECTKNNISIHFKSIFKSQELDHKTAVKDFLTTAKDGKSYKVKHYNLDSIISVGYRVNSLKATQFRRWATKILSEFAIKGYVLDKERLENGSYIGKDYFETLLAEIREIRLSERKLYQKITDIYATSLDYDKSSPLTKTFFAKIQNKLHYAIHGNTASELIYNRADSSRKNMGLHSWRNSPNGKIIKTDVVIAKNYLNQEELESLGRIVNAYLDLAEERAKRNIPMTMEDWSKRLDLFLEYDDREILKDAGAISAEIAKNKVKSEFEKFRITQDKLFESDFDKELINKLENAKPKTDNKN